MSREKLNFNLYLIMHSVESKSLEEFLYGTFLILEANATVQINKQIGLTE